MNMVAQNRNPMGDAQGVDPSCENFTTMREGVVLHPIKVAALRSGLSTHQIRVWEKRYGAVTPARSGTDRRMYSEREIERLKLLGRLTEAGHSIGNIAGLEADALQELIRDEPVEPRPQPLARLRSDRKELGGKFVETAVQAIADLNHSSLEATLQEASVVLGQQGVLVHVVGPLAEEIGKLWQSGIIGVAHEHFASAILRTFLGNMSRPFAPNETSPHILTATPTSQLHEIGAMIITAASVAMGWQATFLGASISPVEIASALKQRPARVVGLSVVYPPDDPLVGKEIVRLGQLIPKDVTFMIGGRSAPSYREAIEEAGAVLTGSLEDFMARLHQVRAQ
jgi:DNA-binding transcriptional MerR regulator/methylmalonyl-CoA mutase cobalamin-binding subunit